MFLKPLNGKRINNVKKINVAPNLPLLLVQFLIIVIQIQKINVKLYVKRGIDTHLTGIKIKNYIVKKVYGEMQVIIKQRLMIQK